MERLTQSIYPLHVSISVSVALPTHIPPLVHGSRVQAVDEPVEVRAQLARGGEVHVTWHSHTVTQVRQ